MTYAELSINQKINAKAVVQSWARYAVQHFQGDLDKKVYGFRQTKRGVQRSSLGQNYRFGSGRGRTNALRKTWYQNVASSGERVLIEFLLYGRFLDMGVGRGTSHTDRLVNRQLSLGRSARTRRPWYSKRKSYEVKRLRELLAQQQINLAVDTIENALTLTSRAPITINI